MRKLLGFFSRFFGSRQNASRTVGTRTPASPSTPQRAPQTGAGNTTPDVEAKAREAQVVGESEARLDELLNLVTPPPPAAPARHAADSDLPQDAGDPGASAPPPTAASLDDESCSDGDDPRPDWPDEGGEAEGDVNWVAERAPRPSAAPIAEQIPSPPEPAPRPIALIDISGYPRLRPVTLPRALQASHDQPSSTRSAHSPWPGFVVDEIIERLRAAQMTVDDALALEPIGVRLAVHNTGSTYEDPEPPKALVDKLAHQPRTLGAIAEQADDLDRLELARLVAQALHALHAGDIVTSGLTMSSFAAELRPRPRIWYLDQDSCRPLGGEPLNGHTPLRGVDEDRHELALLIAELLGLDSDNPRLGLAPQQTRDLRKLLQQATGRPAARPAARQWMEVLNA